MLHSFVPQLVSILHFGFLYIPTSQSLCPGCRLLLFFRQNRFGDQNNEMNEIVRLMSKVAELPYVCMFQWCVVVILAEAFHLVLLFLSCVLFHLCITDNKTNSCWFVVLGR